MRTAASAFDAPAGAAMSGRRGLRSIGGRRGLAALVCALLVSRDGASASPAQTRLVGSSFAIVTLPRVSAPTPIVIRFGAPANVREPEDVPQASAAPAPPFADAPISANAERLPPVFGRTRSSPSTRSFWIHRYGDSSNGSNTAYRAQATLFVQTEHVDVWATADGATAAREALRDQRVPAILEALWSRSRDRFGSLADTWRTTPEQPCTGWGSYVHADERLRILVAGHDEIRGPLGYADLASYVRPECRAGAAYASNGLSGLIVEDATWFTIRENRIVRNTSHEMQHLSAYVRHGFRYDEPFVDEGVSRLAQDFALGDDRAAIAHGDSGTRYSAVPYLLAPDASELMRATRPGSTSERAYLGQYGGIYLLQRFLYDSEGDAYRVRLVDMNDRLGIPEVETAAQESTSEILASLARAMWNGLGGDTVFDTMRMLAAHENSSGFLHVRAAKPGDSVTLLPASISFWTSANGMPHVFSTDPTARIVIVRLAGDHPRGLDLAVTVPGTAPSASSPVP